MPSFGALAGLLLLCRAAAGAFADCDGPGELKPGSYSTVDFHSLTWNGAMFYALVPRGAGPLPLIIFMHGSTGQFGMYAHTPGAANNTSAGPGAGPLDIYASHGFVVLFPFVKSPEKDKSPFTTNTDGEYILKALELAKAAQSDASSPLKGAIDLTNVVSAGHSMGATCSIMAGKRSAAGVLRAVVTQHPGICGPFGPPPWPATWSESDLTALNAKTPLLFTTASNDGAFWPAPYTAKHELGCFTGSKVSGPAAFAQFSAEACAEDHASGQWPDAGHNCPFKPSVETPWVLRFAKLYAQLGGRADSRCHELIWGSGESSLRSSSALEHSVIVPPAVEVLV